MINIDGVHLADEVLLPGGILEIVLPRHSDRVQHIAIDIGGSLAKVVYFTRDEPKPLMPSAGDPELMPRSRASTPGGRLKFARFETQKVSECLDFVKTLLDSPDVGGYVGSRPASPQSTMPLLSATGGGSIKYHDLIEEKLGVEIRKFDEMECLVKGINFLVEHVPREVFLYRENAPPQLQEVPPKEAFPYLFVNIGSGVSILKVTSADTFERVSGTSLGGGTFWGLLSLMSDCSSFEEMLELSKSGDNAAVDMLVGDIYGTGYNKIGLKATTIASSMGRLFKMTAEERAAVRGGDLARSLLYMICNNIGQIAYLNAQKHGITRIYFGGYFICGHPITMNALSFAIKFWSADTVRALFLRHEGFVGAVGAFLHC